MRTRWIKCDDVMLVICLDYFTKLLNLSFLKYFKNFNRNKLLLKDIKIIFPQFPGFRHPLSQEFPYALLHLPQNLPTLLL